MTQTQYIIMSKHVVIAGGGLAGISAALKLASNKIKVILIEKRDRLGGRAASITHNNFKQEIDNAQHVLLGCCKELIEFYDNLGVIDKIRFYDKYLFMDKSKKISTLSISNFPSPLHLLPSFLKLHFLSLNDKLAIIRSLMKILCTNNANVLSKKTMGEWLQIERQPQIAIDRFWRYLIVSVMNEEPNRVNCKHAFLFFKEAFLKSKKSSSLGIATVPLSHLYNSVEKKIKNAGGDIFLNNTIERIEFSNNKIISVYLNNNQRIDPDILISALPMNSLAKLIPSILPPRCVPEHVPILGIHLWFDKPFFPYEFIALTDSPIHWIFNKRLNYNEDNTSIEYLHILVSAAREWHKLPSKTIIEMALKELQYYFPESSNSRLINAITTKEGNATFPPTPVFEMMRPEPKTAISNLFLAGDWINTGWPSTMESAVRSGNMAAKKVLETICQNRSAIINSQKLI